MNENTYCCAGCGVDTQAIDEWYMVAEDVWPCDRFAEDHRQFLCIGCLEALLGRELGPHDFTACPLNLGNLLTGSLRLRRRLWGRDPPSSTDEDARLDELLDEFALLGDRGDGE